MVFRDLLNFRHVKGISFFFYALAIYTEVLRGEICLRLALKQKKEESSLGYD